MRSAPCEKVSTLTYGQHKYLPTYSMVPNLCVPIDRLNKVHAGKKLRDHILAQIDIYVPIRGSWGSTLPDPNRTKGKLKSPRWKVVV